MPLISNAYAFKSLKMLPRLFSKTISLYIVIKMKNKLEEAEFCPCMAAGRGWGGSGRAGGAVPLCSLGLLWGC